MFGTETNTGMFENDSALDALVALEQSTQSNVAKMRAHERINIHCKVLVQAGNSSERHVPGVEVVTADVSNGGSMVLSPRPMMVGDIYWLTFDNSQLMIGSLLARCLRCRLVREDAFEVGFRFLSQIDLASAIRDLDQASLV